MKTEKKLRPNELRAVPSTGGGVNFKDGWGNVSVARIYERPGWEARTALYLAAPDLLTAANKLNLALFNSNLLHSMPQSVIDTILDLRAAIAQAEGREVR